MSLAFQAGTGTGITTILRLLVLLQVQLGKFYASEAGTPACLSWLNFSPCNMGVAAALCSPHRALHAGKVAW
jgi:hypothetical protein